MRAKTCSRHGRLVWIAAAAVVMSVFSAATATAQTLRGEFAGGYAHFHETDFSVPAGWFASGGASLNDWFGLVGSVSGHYKTETLGTVSVKTRLHTFVAGPKFMYHVNRLTPYVTLLAGGARASGKTTVASAINTGAKTRFDAQTGAGLDLDATRNLGVRVGVTGDYIHVDNEWKEDVQFLAGMVAHW